MVVAFKFSLIAMAAPLVLAAQVSVTGVSTTATQAILQYTSPVETACSLKVADMDRSITLASGGQASGQVTIQTSAPHGLLTGAVVYIENSGVPAWNGWQVITSVPAPGSFTFANATAGTTTQGNAGVLVDDVNPALFAGADQDSRPGNVTTGQMQGAGQPGLVRGGRSRSFVVGLRYAQFASDGNRYSRALQANARHHYTLTCGAQSFDQEFRTQNIPLGNTHNDGPLGDRSYPGQYAYPTVQWFNQNQTLIDPVTGLRSFRATAPLGTPSLAQTFVTALDLQSAWQNRNAPLNNFGGAAMFTGPCPSGTCPLFLRADNLNLPGGPTYTTDGSSLDWVSVTVGQASINNPACTGDDCKIVACLTANGRTCASANREASLTGTPANYTFGSGGLMDLWQGAGTPGITRVDASQTSGTVNYAVATKQATVASGYPFNVKWTAGSTINIAGAQYTIASVQSELKLTLSTGPSSDLGGVPYSANNFGVLIWKKTATGDRISIGYTTYLYGSSGMPSWAASYRNPCSPIVAVSGKPGYNCFVGDELYWIAADGSDIRDIGLLTTTYYPPNYYFQDGASFASTGDMGSSPYPFDPNNGDIFYSFKPIYYIGTNSKSEAIIQAHYLGTHARTSTPGVRIPDCTVNGGVQPCVLFTVMQPNQSDAVENGAPLFNPDYRASGFVSSGVWNISGVSPDGDIAIWNSSGGQEWPSWMFAYTLGDRTPTGTGPGSLRIIAGASTYRKAPVSWCTLHDLLPPAGGWFGFFSNDMTFDGARGTYNMTLTSAALNGAVGAAGGLNACPPNPFGVTGANCTAITVTGQPTSALDGSVLQNAQVGDLMWIDSESVRVLSIASATSLTIQRGYPFGAAVSHSSTTFTMECGTRNSNGATLGLWNYRNDPYGTNTNWNTLISDSNQINGHGAVTGGIPTPEATVTAGDVFNMGALCPISQGQDCYQVRRGYFSTAIGTPVYGVASSPPFAGVVGIGQSNWVDMHPGPSFSGYHFDSRPLFGGSSLGGSSSPFVLGPWSAPWVNTTGQIWKASGGNTILNRKILPTLAYVGRFPLVDVSGPGVLLGSTAADSYKYCYAQIAGECAVGSAAGDVYVNAPFVSYPYCKYPGIATQDDDSNGICIADLGANTGNITQTGHTTSDLSGVGTRRLGPNYSKWNQHYVFWNNNATPNGAVLATRVRWLDGVRHEDLMTIVPPFPDSDGVARNSFLPVTVAIDPPAGSPVQSAIVEFGYAENGDPGSYYCTSRQETCVAASAAISQTTPFYFAQSEQYVGVPCATGCTITVPALSQRVLYYRWKYLSGPGQVVGSSQVRVIVTP